MNVYRSAVHLFAFLSLLGALLTVPIVIAGVDTKGLLIAYIILALIVSVGVRLVQVKLDVSSWTSFSHCFLSMSPWA